MEKPCDKCTRNVSEAIQYDEVTCYKDCKDWESWKNEKKNGKTRVIVAGKFDPILAGHLQHIQKASSLGDYLIIITHEDEIVARVSDKKFCACPLWARRTLLEGLIHIYSQGKGAVIISLDSNGESAQTLRYIREMYPKDTLIFAKGGDRTDASKMPASELKTCQELDIEIRYGVGELLSSSSKTMQQIKESELEKMVTISKLKAEATSPYNDAWEQEQAQKELEKIEKS